MRGLEKEKRGEGMEGGLGERKGKERKGLREGKGRKRACGKEMTGKNGWGSERVEDGKDDVKAEEKEQKRRREMRVLHPSDSAALASVHV